jgi:hypothetical protein
MAIDDDVNVLLVSLSSSDFSFFNENVHIGSGHATKQHITMIFPVLECVLGMILYPRYSSHILTLAYGYAMIPFNNHMEVFDTTTYFTHIEHYSTNSLTKGVSSASVIELVINLAFSSLMIKTFSSINKQLEIFILGDDKSKKIWDLTGQSIQCGVRMCKCFIEFPSERFLSAALSFKNCVFISFNHLVGSYIMESNLENMVCVNYSLDSVQGLMFGHHNICEVLEELLSFLEKLLVRNSFVVVFDRSHITILTPFLNHIVEGSNDMRKLHNHQYLLVLIFGLYCLKNVVGGSKEFYHVGQNLKNRLEVPFVIQLLKNWLKDNFEVEVYFRAESKTHAYVMVVIVASLFLKVPTLWPICQHSKMGSGW